MSKPYRAMIFLMKAKQNWEELKLQFFLSNHITLKEFLGDKGVTYNSRTRTRTKGWTREKKAYLRHTNERIKEMVIKEKGEEMKKAISHLLGIIQYRIIMHPQELSYRELKSSWEILRTELGLPVKISDKVHQIKQQNQRNKLNDKAAMENIRKKLMAFNSQKPITDARS